MKGHTMQTLSSKLVTRRLAITLTRSEWRTLRRLSRTHPLLLLCGGVAKCASCILEEMGVGAMQRNGGLFG